MGRDQQIPGVDVRVFEGMKDFKGVVEAVGGLEEELDDSASGERVGDEAGGD